MLEKFFKQVSLSPLGLEEPKTDRRGIHFDDGGFMPCTDDEDICDFGSGDSGGTVGGGSSGGRGGGASSPPDHEARYGDVSK